MLFLTEIWLKMRKIAWFSLPNAQQKTLMYGNGCTFFGETIALPQRKIAGQGGLVERIRKPFGRNGRLFPHGKKGNITGNRRGEGRASLWQHTRRKRPLTKQTDAAPCREEMQNLVIGKGVIRPRTAATV